MNVQWNKLAVEVSPVFLTSVIIHIYLTLVILTNKGPKCENQLDRNSALRHTIDFNVVENKIIVYG